MSAGTPSIGTLSGTVRFSCHDRVHDSDGMTITQCVFFNTSLAIVKNPFRQPVIAAIGPCSVTNREYRRIRQRVGQAVNAATQSNSVSCY